MSRPFRIIEPTSILLAHEKVQSEKSSSSHSNIPRFSINSISSETIDRYNSLGSILNGVTSSINESLHFYDTCLSGITLSEERKFMGMIYPGNSDTHYSLTNTFVNLDKKPFNFSTLTNGSERPIYPLGYWEDVLPMDILPNELYRSIVSEDIESVSYTHLTLPTKRIV